MKKLCNQYVHTFAATREFSNACLQYSIWKHWDKKQLQLIDVDYDAIFGCLRDSMFWRYKYSIDLLWKYLKSFLKDVHAVDPAVPNPSNIIREAARIRIITETQAEVLIDMVKVRNMTSHIYQEEIAEILSGKLGGYHGIMQEVLEVVRPLSTL